MPSRTVLQDWTKEPTTIWASRSISMRWRGGLRALDRRAVGRTSPKLVFRTLVLDPGTLEVTLNGEPVPLSRREFAVLRALMQRPGIVCSRSQLEECLYCWRR